MALRNVWAVALSAAALTYPFVVYLAVGHVAPHWLAGALCLIALTRAALARDRLWCWIGAVTGALALASAYSEHAWQMLKLYPVVVNASFLAVFAASVLAPPTVIERLARLTDSLLPPHVVLYTRNVTLVWCGFFLVNGMLALATALWASDRVWTLYNGFLAYVAMALLFAGELCVRRRLEARARMQTKGRSATESPVAALCLKEIND